MADHEELINEIKTLETLTPQERLDFARRRRMLQLQRYSKQEEKERLHPPLIKANRGRPVRFQPNISLIEAAARNDHEEVLLLLEQGISANLQNDDGLSALHQAVIEDCMDVVQALLGNGADPNIQDDDLWTPLHAAVACGNLDIAVYLVEHGASLVLLNADGNMPIDLVEEFEDIERYLDDEMTRQGLTEDELESLRNVVADKMLEDLEESLAVGRSLNVKNDQGATAMHIAAAYGYEDVIEFLLDHGAKIDEIDNDGWQPIHAAACWSHDSIIEILVNHGADLDVRTNCGEAPVDLTEDEDLRDIIVELKESGRKTKEIKRTQSNSSRTLCVRRSSLVQKHEISSNDAKKEGMYRQNPEFLQVYIDSDNNDETPIESNGVTISPGSDGDVKFEGQFSPTNKNPSSPKEKEHGGKNNKSIEKALASQNSPRVSPADKKVSPTDKNSSPVSNSNNYSSSTTPTKRLAPQPPRQAPIARQENESPAPVKSGIVWEKAPIPEERRVKEVRPEDKKEPSSPDHTRNNKPPREDVTTIGIAATKNTAEVKRRSRRQSIKKTCCVVM